MVTIRFLEVAVFLWERRYFTDRPTISNPRTASAVHFVRNFDCSAAKSIFAPSAVLYSTGTGKVGAGPLWVATGFGGAGGVKSRVAARESSGTTFLAGEASAFWSSSIAA